MLGSHASLMANTSGLAIFGRFWIKGNLPYQIPQYQLALESTDTYTTCSRPEAGLRMLFLYANTSVNRSITPYVEPLQGYRTGDTVTRNELGCNLLRIAERAGQARVNHPTGIADAFLEEVSFSWVYREAVSALIFLTGVEGALALLRSPRIGSADKWQLSGDLFSGARRLPYIFPATITDPERELLVHALHDRTLAKYAKRLEEPLRRRCDA